MPLSELDANRKRVHLRSVAVEGFKRADGLWDIEARLLDTKDQDYPLPSGLLRAGEAIHEMRVRVTIDGEMNILAAEACTDAAPYPGECEKQPRAYSALVGLNLFDGYMKSLKTLFGGTQGCAHIRELLMFLPTVALQTLHGDVAGKADESIEKPYPLDRCHALESHSATVQRYYPRWYRHS